MLTCGSFPDLLEKCKNVDEPHSIGNVTSQLHPAGWIQELYHGEVWDPDSHFILDGVLHGFKIVDTDAKIDSYFNKNYRSATCQEHRFLLQDLLNEEIESGNLSSSQPVCVHSLGVIVKPSGGIRPITDCKRPLNSSVNNFMTETFSTFQYKSCDDAMSLISQGCWMACVDLQSAYRSVAIHPSHRKFCGLSWNFGNGERFMTDNFLSFGQRCAPFILNRLTDFISRNMHLRGYNCINYLDDFF